jgi:hypothetical protein
MTVGNIVRLTSYLTDASYAEANAGARVAALGGRVVPTTAIVVQTIDNGWLIEIEVTGRSMTAVRQRWFSVTGHDAVALSCSGQPARPAR